MNKLPVNGQDDNKENAGCACAAPQGMTILPSMNDVPAPSSCGCGGDDIKKADPNEKPGYAIMSFVEQFKTTDPGQVPMIRTTLDPRDIASAIKVRLGIGRDHYTIAPGLYCTGNPDARSPVLVTANYKLSFDYLRKELKGISAWILVLDTIGVNVWCAAGKGTFGTEELVNRIAKTHLDKIIDHKTVILPQLGATGVSAFQVRKQSGFKVVWGPIRAKDIPAFLNNNMNADPEMRKVTFTITERAVLVPVELKIALKPALYVLISLFVLSGIGHGIFSFSAALERGAMAGFLLLAGMITGAVLTPILLPWIYGKAFSLKGLVTGLVLGIPTAIYAAGSTGATGVLSLVMMTCAVSSFLAMNFTGTTPFTSPSGVEKEMRIAIPIQAGAVIFGILLWVYTGF